MTTEGRVRHLSWLVPAIALVASAATAIAVMAPAAFASKGPNVQLAVNTAVSVIAIVAGTLLFGRFRESRALGDLLLVVAFLLLLLSNLGFAAVPALIGGDTTGRFADWASEVGRFSAYLTLTAAAFSPPRHFASPRRPALAALAGSLALLAVIGVAVAVLGS